MIQAEKTNAYYTVPEFAELAGVSKQAVYQRIRRDLKGYTIKEAGVTKISRNALDLVGSKDVSKVDQEETSKLKFELDYESSGVDQAESKVDQAESQPDSKVDQAESSGLLEYLKQDVERLHAEIDRLNGIIEEKDAQISEFARRFADIAEKEQDVSSRALATAGQAQMLHAMSEQPEMIDAPQEPQEDEKKRPWWKRKGK